MERKIEREKEVDKDRHGDFNLSNVLVGNPSTTQFISKTETKMQIGIIKIKSDVQFLLAM